MTTAPAADQRRLLDVQALDTRLDQIAHKKRTLPELARLTELGSQVTDLHTALVTSQTAVSDLQRELRQRALLVGDLVQAGVEGLDVEQSALVRCGCSRHGCPSGGAVV